MCGIYEEVLFSFLTFKTKMAELETFGDDNGIEGIKCLFFL